MAFGGLINIFFTIWYWISHRAINIFFTEHWPSAEFGRYRYFSHFDKGIWKGYISLFCFSQSAGPRWMAGPGAGGVQDQQQAGVCHQLVHFQGGLLNKQKGPNKHINQSSTKKAQFDRLPNCQGLEHVSWESLYSSVITSFRERNILKQLSTDELVFQVFCIKQLLK